MKHIFLVLALISIKAMANLTSNELQLMQSMGALISFDVNKKPQKISKKMSKKDIEKIKFLSFNGKKIYHIPDYINKLTFLEKLDLDNAGINIEELKNLRSLKKLKILNVSNNRFFPNQANFSLYSVLLPLKLEELNLSNTGGRAGHYVNIGFLQTLKKLNLSRNYISRLYAIKLKYLVKLEELDLSKNRVGGTLHPKDDLPINSIKSLNLSDNSFRKVAYEGDLPNLEEISFLGNKQVMKFDRYYGDTSTLKKIKKFIIDKDVIVSFGLRKKLDKLNGIVRIEGIAYENRPFKQIFTWEGAKRHCKNRRGWRLPNIEELKKLLTLKDTFNSKKESHYIRKEFLENMPSESWFWSSTTFPKNPKYAWTIDFSYGNKSWNKKTGKIYTLCVKR